MTDIVPTEAVLLFDCELDAPQPKVWRALSIPALREQWLPSADLVDAEGTPIEPGQAIRYRMRESAPPFRESHVTIRLSPGRQGGTHIRIVHELAKLRAARTPAANANLTARLRAA
ncbi:hypothetical protein BJF93_03865 [Xaviernesmea oryzae]|uniref:Polyketide cyclase n=1 Tax=Xaviernesmea oryzae TaxID=464029 RepID=A0A1Q9AUD7_9HYPH|nr:SRPBCC domain-containing protein [Xaviernesmea oryzae]OLP59069.1 hypothetical protein BJF93_03865 [Xaviernesmea oryzae]SEK88086.1 Uncharacterized conserved protein YndB, AHSA1/START domain [Xaviernesmea oryzae]